MNRLTTDNPDGNFETTLNYAYGKDGLAHIRSDGANEDISLIAWADAQCKQKYCYDFPPEESPEEVDQRICDCMMDDPVCPIALAYCFASQAVHLRDRLKMYEDILFAADGTELVSLDELREAVKEMVEGSTNQPLTLEELYKMDGEPVWIEFIPDAFGERLSMWALVSVDSQNNEIFLLNSIGGSSAYEEVWADIEKIYRRKP